jgi:hypothetical protein
MTFLNTSLLSLALIVFVSACQGQNVSDDSPLLAGQDIPRNKILESFSYLYYRDNPLPPTPSLAELNQTKTLYGSNAIDPKAAELMEKVFGAHMDLRAYALRDTDQDGIKDFRVSHFQGKFSEGDLDLDGDGVLNIHDSAPYDPTLGGKDLDGDGLPDSGFTDINKNGLADHIDWDLLIKDSSRKSLIAPIQWRLFKNHKIAMVERNADMDASTTQAVADSIELVFRKKFTPGFVLSTLRTIASEKIAMIHPEVGGETNAMVVIGVKSLIVYESGLKAPPLVKLGLLVHEIGHSFQYAADVRHKDPAFENNRAYYPAPRYMKQMKPFDWQADSEESDQWIPYKVFTPTYEIVRPKFTFKSQTPAFWKAHMQKAIDQFGNQYLSSPLVLDQGIVSGYSLGDPFEWLSDNQIAYLFVELEDAANLQQLGISSPKLREKMEQHVAKEWPDFRHTNFRKSLARPFIEAKFPLTNNAKMILADRYLKSAVMGSATGMSLTGYGKGRRCHRHP